MSTNIASYTFLPWLRNGIANKIAAADGDPAVALRAAIQVNLSINGEKKDGSGTATENIPKSIQLYGPGDVIGLDPKAIVKTEPRNWITNYEPNYFPHVDFYDEDFCWRYTPAAPDAKDRLRPWITLVVLEEKEFEEGKNALGRPLPYINVPDAIEKFPPAESLWAWAHVHISEALMDDIVAPDAQKNAITAKLQGMLASNPDLGNSRLICPRKLKDNTPYHAFIIPTFEAGRLAGIGKPLPATLPASQSAWADAPDREEASAFPIYHRWYFHTGAVGDFEYLVRLLVPRAVDSRVGNRDMDVQFPGSNIRGITTPAPGGILRLGGALRVPQATLPVAEREQAELFDLWDKAGYPQLFQQDLAAFVNLADDYSIKTAAEAHAETPLPTVGEEDEDPMITAPLYGRWHALVNRLLLERNGSDVAPQQNWIHDLNLDPRYRVPAGLGTKVIQDNQEMYMDAAWQQVGDILAANRWIRLAQLSLAVSDIWYVKHLVTVKNRSSAKFLLLTAPLQKRVMAGNTTVFYNVLKSPVTATVLSSPMRKIMRPRGPVLKRIVAAQPDKKVADAAGLVEKLNEGTVTIAPPHTIPATLPTPDALADDIAAAEKPPVLAALVRQYPWLKWLFFVIAILLLLLCVVFAAAGIISLLAVAAAVAVGLAFWRAANQWEAQEAAVNIIREEQQLPATVDSLPLSPDFRISDSAEDFLPAAGTTDSAEAVLYKQALRESLVMMQALKKVSVVAPRRKMDLAKTAEMTVTAINPLVTIPKLVLGNLLIPTRIKEGLKEVFTEAMAYPVIDTPMYKALVTKGGELFLPNLNLIPENTISLLETNQKFIEAYMVGLNHEFSRELLWREYPTDQRGSSFRQFWEVNGTVTDDNLSEDARREKLRDIPPLHRWSKYSRLGDHDHRESGGDKEEELVLVIRGELLKKYPNAVVYAHKAEWQKNANGSLIKTKERQLVTLSPAQEAEPPESIMLTPLYEARVDPDLYFFGFDLTANIAKGAGKDDAPTANNAGWFFGIKERPGEPRFGLDIDRPDTTPNVWNDLSWKDVATTGGGGKPEFLKAGAGVVNIPLHSLLPDDIEKSEQRTDDNSIAWSGDMNAAELAYVLYQVPVLVAVHASEMLPKT